MSEFRPSTIVAKLAEKLHGKPIAENIRSDGTVVIVFEDGRKLTFDRDAITRTLTEPLSMDPDHPVLKEIIEAGGKPKRQKSNKESPDGKN